MRNCHIRGFHSGIVLGGGNGAGHLVEDNRLDNNLKYGIFVQGDNNRIRRNAVYDTGGYPASQASYGIDAYADVIDNTVAGVFAATTNASPRGIFMFGRGNQARGNQVRGLAVAGSGQALGIHAGDPVMALADNWVSAATTTAGTGISASGSFGMFCMRNTVVNFATPYAGCDHSVDNL